jgi:hypothetical protein
LGIAQNKRVLHNELHKQRILSVHNSFDILDVRKQDGTLQGIQDHRKAICIGDDMLQQC